MCKNKRSQTNDGVEREETNCIAGKVFKRQRCDSCRVVSSKLKRKIGNGVKGSCGEGACLRLEGDAQGKEEQHGLEERGGQHRLKKNGKKGVPRRAKGLSPGQVAEKQPGPALVHGV